MIMQNLKCKMQNNVFLLVFALIFACFSSSSFADERRGDQGVGIVVGAPSGLTWKMWLDERIGLDVTAGVRDSELDLHANLLWHNFAWLRRSNDKLLKDIAERGELPYYFGFGPRVLLEDKTEFGVRLPVGLAFLPHDTHWEFLGEFAPILRLTPDTGFNADFLVGVRYYFKAIRPRSNP